MTDPERLLWLMQAAAGVLDAWDTNTGIATAIQDMRVAAAKIRRERREESERDMSVGEPEP